MKKLAQPKKTMLECKVFQKNFMWFEVFHSLHPELITGEYDTGKTQASFTCNFDYETLPGGVKRFYADIVLKVLPYAAILTRTGFEINAANYTWDKLFTPDMIKPMVKTSIANCLEGFKDQCTSQQVEFKGEVSADEETTASLTDSIIKMYNIFRKHNDVKNKKLLESGGLKVTSGNHTRLCLLMTFMVIDEVLYFNPQFDRTHNKEQFSKVVPEHAYFTVKMNCLNIKTQKVELSLYHTLFFLVCLDCSIQLLLGDHETELMKSLESRGLNNISRELFIKEGSKLLEYFRQTMIQSKAEIPYLDVRYDWNSLMK